MRTHDVEEAPDLAPVTAGGAPAPAERDEITVGDERDPGLDTSQFRVLATAGQLLASSLDYEETLRDVARMAVPALADACVVRVVEDGGHSVAVAHVDRTMEPLLAQLTARPEAIDPVSPVARVLRDAQPVLLADMTRDGVGPLVSDPALVALAEHLGLRSGMVVPLEARGRAQGTLSFMSSVSGRVFGDGEVALARALGQQAGVAIENARLYAREQHARQEAEKAQHRFAILADLGAALAGMVDLDRALSAVADITVPGVADLCAIDLLTPEGAIERRAVRHHDPTVTEAVWELQHRYPLTVDDPVGPGHVIATGAPEHVPEIREELLSGFVRDEEHAAMVRSVAMASYLTVPLVVNERTLGAITLATGPGDRRLSTEDLALVEGVAQRTAVAVENATLYAQAREAQRAREESLALLDTLLVSAPVGLAFWDRRMRYVRVNDALAAMDGVPTEAHVGRHLSEVVPAFADEIAGHIRRVLDGGGPQLNVEVSGATPASPGRLRHWLYSYYPVPAGDGSMLGVGAVVAEITERKRAEEDRERLYRDLREFRATLDTTNDSVYIFDPDTLRFRYVNRGAVESTGYSRDELLEMTPVDLKPEYDEARFRQTLDPLLGDPERSATITTAYRRKDGRTFPVEISLQYVQPPGEAGRVVAIVRDVTDRVAARARLQRLAQSERALNAELKSIIRAMGDAVLVMDPLGRVVLANPAAATILEAGPIQRYDDVLRRLDDPEHVAPTPGDTEPRGPVELRVSGAAERWLELSSYPVLPPGDVVHDAQRPAEALETILFMRDVTEPRRARVARDAFIGVLSHELRTPVTTIFGNSKLLGRTDRTLPLDSRRELITGIEMESERLYRLVEDLLVLARYGEDAPRELANEPVLLQRIVPSVIRSEQPRWPGTTFDALIPPNLPAVEGDPTYVEQVVRNLLTNAAKYGGDDGARVTIVLEAGEAEASVRVLDDGPGFEVGETDHLFELFYRSPRAKGHASGAGIGLFVCRRLVEAMGGRIWARRRPAGGAEFGFVLQLFFEEDV